MHKNTAIFLQVMVAFLALAVLFLMVRTPLTEGRAKELDLFHIYTDPFILYGYTASIPFFIGAYKLFRLFGYLGQGKVYQVQAIAALGAIWYCAILFGVLVAGAGLYIRLFHSKEDDPAGFLAICLVATFAAAVVAIAAVRYEKKLKNRLQ